MFVDFTENQTFPGAKIIGEEIEELMDHLPCPLFHKLQTGDPGSKSTLLSSDMII